MSQYTYQTGPRQSAEAPGPAGGSAKLPVWEGTSPSVGAQYRDSILQLKGDFAIAIAKNPKELGWVLVDGAETPIWWRYADGELQHELETEAGKDEITRLMSIGEWRKIPINQDTRQHRERMLMCYGAQPAIEPYPEIQVLEFVEEPDREPRQPVFRLYDVTTDSLCEYPDEKKVKFIAVSHVWSQSTDQILKEACTRAHEKTNQTKFWVDKWCIRQTSKEDKAFHVPKMKDYYTAAQAVLVICPDLTVARDASAEEFVEAIRRTRWFSRIWCFQESMSSKRLMLDNGSLWEHKIVEEKIRRCHGERANQRGKIEGVKLNDDLWIDSQGRLTMAISDILYSTGGRMWNLIVDEEKAKVSLTRLLHQTQYRRCRLEEDRLYGMMGLAHAAASIKVEYGVGLATILLSAAGNNALDSKILASTSTNPAQGACWLPDTSTLGTQETFKGLSSQGRQTLTAGSKGLIVWCTRKEPSVGSSSHGEDNAVEEWVVEDYAPDKIVLSLTNNGDGSYHRVGSHVEIDPKTTGEATPLEVGILMLAEAVARLDGGGS